MIKFLIALGSRPIARLMAAGGFDNDDYKRGYDLFRQAMGPELIETGPVSLFDPAAHELLDDIDATLRHEHPVLHERLFRNISKTTGPEVVYTVGTFLDRLNELEQEGGAEIEAALALLAKRRLTKKKRAAAEALIKDATKLNVGDLPVEADMDFDALDGTPSEAEKARLEAEEQMWAWFKDWAQIARTIVKDKRYRYSMGISQWVDRSDADGPEVADVPSVTVVTPAATSAPMPVAPRGQRAECRHAGERVGIERGATCTVWVLSAGRVARAGGRARAKGRLSPSELRPARRTSFVAHPLFNLYCAGALRAGGLLADNFTRYI